MGRSIFLIPQKGEGTRLTKQVSSGRMEGMNLDRTLLTWARQAWRMLGWAVLAGYGGGLLAIAQAWLLSRVIAGVFLDGQGLNEVLPQLAAMLAVFGGRAVLAWVHEASGAAGAVQVKNGVRETLMTHLFQIGPAAIQGQAAGELVAKVKNLKTRQESVVPLSEAADRLRDSKG